MIIDDASDYNYEMEYYNADGSTDMLCGNGARCAIKYAYNSNRVSNKTAKFIHNKISYSGEVLSNENVKFFLSDPSNIRQDEKLDFEGLEIPYSYIETGTRHIVVHIDECLIQELAGFEFDSIKDFPVEKFGKLLRNDSIFNPIGTNVNIIKINEESVILRTFEKGVESETLACGTGAVASAIISALKYKLTPPIKVMTKGGENLIVDFEINNEKITGVSLTGSADEIFNGEFLI